MPKPAPSPLAADPAAPEAFTFRLRKSADVEVLHHGRVVTVLRGADAAAFLARVRAGDAYSAQKHMARITGNYRRGNERLASGHPRNRR